jgi:hypothetical protein
MFPLFTLKCVSYKFLSLSSRKFNIAERLIYMWLWDRSHVDALMLQYSVGWFVCTRKCVVASMVATPMQVNRGTSIMFGKDIE